LDLFSRKDNEDIGEKIKFSLIDLLKTLDFPESRRFFGGCDRTFERKRGESLHGKNKKPEQGRKDLFDNPYRQ